MSTPAPIVDHLIFLQGKIDPGADDLEPVRITQGNLRQWHDEILALRERISDLMAGMSGIKYHGEVFDEGRMFLTIDGETAGHGGIVMIKRLVGGALVEFAVSCNQAREIARHLSSAAAALTSAKRET